MFFFFHDNISGVTVMLSLTVFMNIVSELMPITSDAVPLVGRLTARHDTIILLFEARGDSYQ